MIEKIRENIDQIDTQLLMLLGKRVQLSKRMAQLKAQMNIDIVDHNIWRQKLQKIKKECEENGIEYNEIVSVFSQIHSKSIEIQKSIQVKA